MIVFIRCNDIISNSRAKKYLNFLNRKKTDHRIIAWDRLGNSTKLPNVIYCPSKSKYNQGGMAAIIDRLKWMWFILKTLFSFHDDLTIHACDLDAAFPSAVYKLLSRRKNYVLFDVFDWISDTLYNQGKIVSAAFVFMEWLSVKEADHLIICEPERIKQIPYDIEGRYSVLQNIPSFSTTDFLYEEKSFHFDNNLFTLVYVGGFTNDRCLSEVIDGAAQGYYNLNIAGYGAKDVVSKLDSLKNCPHIRYYGKVEYTKGLRIMFNSDIIYAMYSKMNPNHLYAAPNKFYEAMFVGKPIITTNGIVTADKVKQSGIGYSIDETVDGIIQLVRSLSKEDICQKAQKASELWPLYKNATEIYLETTYSDIIQPHQ
jgi:glycosyltransferase involved in cell wall biosynthesis